MKRIILPGLLAGAAMLIAGFGINFLFGIIAPAVALEMKNPAIFRPWSDPRMMLYFVYPFILGIVLAWAWSKSKWMFKGPALHRGIYFGLAYFVVAGIPGMFITYSSFAISATLVLSWLISGFINGVVAGIVLAKLNK